RLRFEYVGRTLFLGSRRSKLREKRKSINRPKFMLNGLQLKRRDLAVSIISLSPPKRKRIFV
ncbi:hypothetical protein, partial [Geobacillus thermoleovorans]|uniref:hypothetical protein n=1 Tax=Geobacillus thermoleovorans TaxID=33941 RepID=UPI00272EBAB1